MTNLHVILSGNLPWFFGFLHYPSRWVMGVLFIESVDYLRRHWKMKICVILFSSGAATFHMSWTQHAILLQPGEFSSEPFIPAHGDNQFFCYLYQISWRKFLLFSIHNQQWTDIYVLQINSNTLSNRFVFWRSKKLWLDGFLKLNSVLSAKELSDLQEVMHDKELNLRTDIYEILLQDELVSWISSLTMYSGPHTCCIMFSTLELARSKCSTRIIFTFLSLFG